MSTDTRQALAAQREQFEAWWEQRRQESWIANRCHETRGPTPNAAWSSAFKPHALEGWAARDAEINRVRAEAEALRKDAERYRWLRDPSNGKALQIMREYGLEDAKDLDDAIDAAIAATKEQQA